MLARYIIVPVFAVLGAARAITENPFQALAPRDCTSPGVTSFCVSSLFSDSALCMSKADY